MGDTRSLPLSLHTYTTHAHHIPPLPLTFDLCPAAVELTSLSGSVEEKGVHCRRLKDQLDTLERETTEKLGQMEQYSKELQVSGPEGRTERTRRTGRTGRAAAVTESNPN